LANCVLRCRGCYKFFERRHCLSNSRASFGHWRNAIILTLAVGVAYFLAARFSLALIAEASGVAVFWPAAGVSAGVLIALGPAARLPVVVGVVGATVAANLLGDRNLWSSMVFAACNAGEAVLVATLLDRYFGPPFSLDSFVRVLGFLAAVLIGTAASGIGGTVGYLAFHHSTASTPEIWYEWFASDAVGIITVAPFLIGLFGAVRDRPQPTEIVEGLLISLLVILSIAVTIYLPQRIGPVDANDFLVLFPLLVWAAARCRPAFTAAACFIATLTIVWITTFAIGTVGDLTVPITERIFVARAALFVFSFGGLVVAALFAERRKHVITLEQRETQLEAALRTARLAENAKSSFLAAASHDLRQPLQTLKLWLATLARNPRTAEEDYAITVMVRSLETTSSMLDSLLDLNQLEAGNLRPSLSEFPINDVFGALEADFRMITEKKGLEWRVVRSEIWVQSDRRLLEQMLRNLLSNAVRFTDQGKVLIGCRRTGETVRIEVWDSGVGIVGDQLSRIFEEHFRTEDTPHPGGFGLGLAIVQRLGTILDHRIDVRSTPGKGSKFAVAVPRGQAKVALSARSEVEPNTVDARSAGMVLIIEDESTVREALVTLLRSEGLSAISVATPNEALALVTGQGIRPDLILSDYNLPGKMNGVESIEALRRLLARKIPAIVLTGEMRSTLVETIAKHDISVVVKPSKPDELLDLIRRLSDQTDNATHAHLVDQASREI